MSERADTGQIWLREMLTGIRDQQRETAEEVRELRADVGCLRREVAVTYAREVDCAARAERLEMARAEGLRRVFGELEGLGMRVGALEARRQRDSGAHEVKRMWAKRLGAVVVPLIVAALTGVAGWLMRGCA